MTDWNEATLRWLNDYAAQGILATDAELNIRGWNNWLGIYSGHRVAEVIGRNLLEVYPELVERRMDQYYRDALAGQARILSYRLHRYLLPMSSDYRPGLMAQSARIAPLVEDGRVIGTITVIEDVTERVERENTLRESEARYRAVSELTSDFTYAFRVEPDGTRVREWVTAGAFSRITGFTLDELGADGDWSSLIHPDDMPVALRQLQVHLAREPDVVEYRIVTKSGEVRWLRDYRRPVWDEAQGRVVRVIGAAQDITERVRAEETIKQMAYHDPLTGLPNRLLLNDRLTLALAHAQRSQQKLAVMLLDLDYFKEVNDTLGHSVGDQLLQVVSKRLASLLRKGDTVARMGGDEFMLLLPEISQVEGAAEVAQKILEAFRRPFVLNGHDLHITTSIGIALYPDDGEDSDTLMKNADIAMYRAKDQGRDNYQSWRQ